MALKGHLTLLIAWLAVLVPGVNSAFAAVTLTVTPSAISNTYTGVITLNITNLTSGEEVKVQTYLDLNGSGVLETNDPLVDVFDITDGGVEVIGGITNISVPYDSNPATGAITTTLSFAPEFESVVGQKIYRVVSDPSGAFTPVTAVLDITNAPTGQTVSGIVYSNGIAPLPYAVVLAQTLTNQNYFSAAIADATGHYSLAVAPGTYVLVPTLPGFYADESLLPVVTLTNGMSATNNLSLTNGVVTISGPIYDAVNSNSLGGVLLTASSGTLIEAAFSDTNGNYAFNVTSNNWKIKLAGERLARRGYVSLQGTALTVDAAFGDVANAGIGLYKGNALFYGQVTISNEPVPNAAMLASEDEELINSKSYTDLNGNYGVVVLVNTNVLPSGDTWGCGPNTGDETGPQIETLANYIFNQAVGVGFTTNEAVAQNFIGLPITGTISGQLVNNQGVPISDVGVGATATIDGYYFITAFPDTTANGDFSFGVADGQWSVFANCCGSGDSLASQNYYEAESVSVTIPPTNGTANIVAYPANQPILAQPGMASPSQFDFNLYGASGLNYTVQASTNLATTNWSTLTIISNLPGSPYLIQDGNATNPARFYRAFQGP